MLSSANIRGFLILFVYCQIISTAFDIKAKDDLSHLSNEVVKTNKISVQKASEKRLPVFTEHPVDSFVVKNRPAILNCSVIHSDKAYFSCNGEAQSKSGDHVEKNLVDSAGRVVRILSLVIYREQVEEFFDEFRCQCDAWSSQGLTSSRPATVAIGYLNKEFEVPPYSQSVQLGSQVEMRCHPPRGKPPPSISWMKDGQELDIVNDPNYLTAADGHLIIIQVRPQDISNFSCVAENMVNRRVSSPARLEIVVDGGWSSWSPWTDCPSRCGPGYQRRQRVCNNPVAAGLGRQCTGEAEQTQECHHLCIVDGQWSPWSSWSSCSPNCSHHKQRSCSNPSPANGGHFCRGKDMVSGSCGGGMCRPGTDPHLAADSVSVVVTDLSLVIGLSVAITVFLCVTSVAVRVIRSKRTSHSVYNMADMYYQNDNSGKESVATTTTSTRTSKWNETNFSWPGARVASSCVSEDSDKQVLRMAGDWPGSVQTTPLLHTKTDTRHTHPASSLLHDRSSVMGHGGSDRSSSIGPAVHDRTSGQGQKGLERSSLLSPSKSEHQYDVPWSHLLPRKQLTVDTGHQQEVTISAPGGNDYSDIGPEASRQRASPWSVSDDTSLSMSSNSGSMAAGLASSVSFPQLQLTPDNFTVATVTHTGAKLSLPGWGVSLLIPPGALDTGFVEEVFLAVVPLPTPPLGDTQVMLSPVVLAGPPRLTLNKTAVLSLAHCCGGGGDQERWEAEVWHTHSMVTPHHNTSEWNRLVALRGQDQVSNNPVMANLDLDACHVMTPFLGHFCLTGKQRTGGGQHQDGQALRHFKIVSCGQFTSSNSPVTSGGSVFVINVHIVPDTPGSIEAVVKMAEKAGSQLLTKPKHLGVQANISDLQCGVVSTGQGWFVRPVKAEIKARDVRNCFNRDHPSAFVLELEQIAPAMTEVGLELIVTQGGPSISQDNKHSMVKLSLSTDQSSSQRSSSGCSSLSGGLTPQTLPQLRLSPAVRMYLCAALDSGDWTRLAAGLRLSGHIVAWLEHQPSPTDCLLSLWEAAQTDPAAVQDLVNIVRCCVSNELAAALHREAGSWV